MPVSSLDGNPVPRVTVQVLDVGTASSSINSGKRLALVSPAFTFLEPATVTTVGNTAQMSALSPTDYTLGLYAKLIADCSPDKRRDPVEIHLVNPRGDTSRAARTFDDSLGDDALTLSARLWGAIGNRITVAIAAGTNQGQKYTIAGPGYATEVFDDVGGSPIATINYPNTGQATAVTMTFDQTNGLRITQTKSAIALGTYSPNSTMSFDGTVTVTPSGAPGGGQTFTAAFTGLDADGDAATETLTFDSGGGGAAQTTTTVWSAVTSVVFAATAGTPTFTISGYAFDLDTTSYPTATSLIERIDQSGGYTAVAGSASTASTDVDQLDDFASASIFNAAKNLTANLNAAYVALQASAIVEPSLPTGAGLAPANVSTINLLGGTSGTADSTSWTDALTALKDVQCTWLWLDSDSATIHDLGLDHIIETDALPGKARQMYVAAIANETFSQLSTRRIALASRSVCLSFQAGSRLDQNGSTITLTTPQVALMYAALECSVEVGCPLIQKRLRLITATQNSGIDVQNAQATLINAGLNFVALAAGSQWVIIAPIATYGGNNVFFYEPSAVESLNVCVNDLAIYIAAEWAKDTRNTILTAALVKTWMTTRLNTMSNAPAIDKIIRRWNPASLTVQDTGTALIPTVEVEPILPVKFIKVRASAQFAPISLNVVQ